MEIYHGGYCSIKTPEIIKGKYAKDFGVGFYCTELRDQAIRWARRYDSPIVNIYSFAGIECFVFCRNDRRMARLYRRLP